MRTIERRVLELIGEDPDNPDVFLDTAAGIAPVRDSINDAIQEIVMVTGGNKRKYLIPLRAGQQFYRLALDYGEFGWVTDAWLTTKKYRLEQTGLIRLSKYDPRWMTTQADPRAYFQIGTDSIGLYPRPSGSSEVLELTLVEIPQAYTQDNEKIRLKPDYDQAAVHYAVSEYWASRGDANEAAEHFVRYLKFLGIRADYTTFTRSSYMRTGKAPWPVVTT